MAEEWKGQIPPEAISYIQTLEGKFEATLKECKEYQLNLGTSKNELEKCKLKCDTTLADKNTLEREVNRLNAELEQLTARLKTSQTASTNKDNVIFGLQAEIKKSKQELIDLKSINDKIICRAEQRESEQCKSNDIKNNDIEKLKEFKILNEQHLQGNMFDFENYLLLFLKYRSVSFFKVECSILLKEQFHIVMRRNFIAQIYLFPKFNRP